MEFVILLLVVGLLTLLAMPIVAVVQVAKLRGEVGKLRDEQVRLEKEIELLNRRRTWALRGPAELDDATSSELETEARELPDVREFVGSAESPASKKTPASTEPKADEEVVDAVLVVGQEEPPAAPAAASSSHPVPSVAERLAETPEPLDVAAERAAQSGSASRGAAVSLEERLGAKLPVWLGAIALLLAGVFLVAFAVKRGWFSPRMRIYASSALGTALIVAGLALRRRYADIAQGLAAAGVGILYAVVLAVATIFNAEFPFVTTLVSLYLIVGITAVAIGLSLHLGPLVALIGLLGGFATPALIGVGPQHATPLFLCLIAQQLGTSLIGRHHLRWWFGVVALLAVEFYVVAWMLVWWNPLQAPLLGGVLLAGLISFLATSPTDWGVTDLEPSRLRRASASLPWLLPAVPAVVLSSVLVARSELNWINVGLHAAQLAGLTVYAGLRPRFFPLFPVAAGITVATVLLRALGRSGPLIEGELQFSWLQMVTLLFGAILGGGALAASRAGRKVRSWAICGGAALVGLGCAPLLGLNRNEPQLAGLLVLAGLCGLALLATVCCQRWRRRSERYDDATLAFLSSGAAVLLLSTQYVVRWFELTQYAFVVGAGGTVVLVAALTRCWRLLDGRQLVMVLGLVVVLGTINGVTLREELEPHLLWNRATLGYGVAILSLVASGILLRGLQAKPVRRDQPQPAYESWLFAVAAVMLAVYLCVLVRHGFARADSRTPRGEWLELATDLVGIAAVAALVAGVARGLRDVVLRRLALGLAVLALLGTLLGSAGIWGPLVREIDVGRWPLLNWLGYALGVPVLLVGLTIWIDQGFARSAADGMDRDATGRAGLWLLWMTTLIAFCLVQVRHEFWRDAPGFVWQGGASLHVCELPVDALIVGGLAGFAIWWANRRRGVPWQLVATGSFIGFTLLVVGIVVEMNPFWVNRPVGSLAIWNWLWVILALPGIVAAGMAILSHQASSAQPAVAAKERLDWPTMLMAFRGVASVLALLLVWLFVTAEVRQYFVGSTLPGPPPGQTEWYAYSAAWIVLAIALLAIGVWTQASAVRWGSLVLMLLSVGKVFLLDTRHLGDLWRVASYLGLGLSLMLVAYVYQRFVFRGLRGRPGELP